MVDIILSSISVSMLFFGKDTVARMSYKNFGALICCASNGVMKVERVKDLIDDLAKMGYNLLELCIDDMYKIESEPYFGYLRGGYTVEEIREMDAYAASRGVELVPVAQTLAHLTNLVKIPHYADIVDVDDVLLIDEPKTYELIEKMFETLAKCFTSRKVNIGFDEAFKVGLGKHLDKYGYQNRISLLERHLKRVLAIAGKYGFKIHMWSDMFFRLVNHGNYCYDEKDRTIADNIRDRIPEDVELCYWDYYTDDERQYNRMMMAHEQFERELWFAGGAWSWNGFAPHNGFSLRSLKASMKQAKEHNIQNILITMWGDDGHDCSYFSVLPSLYAARQFAEGITDMEIIKKGFKETFDVEFDDFMLLDLPTKNSKNPNADKPDNSCKSLLYNDCFLGMKDYGLREVEHIPYADYAKQLHEAGTRMGRFSYLFENLEALCLALDIKAELGLRTRDAYQSGDRDVLQALVGDYLEAEKRVGTFRDTLRSVWMYDNKPYGWDIQEIRLGGLRARLRDGAQRLQEYLDGTCDRIPELEETLLYYAPWETQFNSYRGFVSVSQL